MFQNQLILRAKGEEDHIYSFTCDPSSKLGEILNALKAMEKVVVDQINKIEEEAKEKECEKVESCS